MPEIRVQDEQGTIHIFPDAATPDMIARVLGVKAPTATNDSSELPGALRFGGTGDTAMREVRAAWETIKSTPSALLHAAIPSAEAGPLEHAIQWYSDAAAGKVPNAIDQVLSVAPEAIGTGAGAVLAGKAIEAAPGAVRSGAAAVRDAAPAVVRGTAKGINMALAKAPGAIGAAAGAAIGHEAGLPGVGAAIGYGIGKEVLPTLKVPGEAFGLKSPTPPLTPAEVSEGASWREPEAPEPPTALEQAKARFQAAQQQQPSTQTPESYPNGVQKRPTDRAEILDDKIVREQMQKDLGLQGYRGAREVGEENAPTPKWQQVAQAKAQSVIDSAHEQAAQILADAEKAATTPAKLTKTVAPKAAAASQAEPVAEDLNSPDRLIDLMQQSIDRLKAAKGK